MDSALNNQISVATEGTVGTAVTPTQSIIIKESDGVQIEQGKIEITGIKATAPKVKSSANGLLDYNGAFEMDIYPQAVGYFLKAAFGDEDDTVTVTDTVYTHLFTEAIAKPSLTLEQKIGTIVKRFAGFIPDSLKFAVKAGEAATLSVTGKALKQADDSAITASYETTAPFTFGDISALTIGGTDFSDLADSIEINYANGLAAYHALGAYEPAALYAGQSEVSGKITMFVDATTDNLLADLIAGTEREIILTFSGEAINSSYDNKLTLTLPKCYVTKYTTKLSYDYNAVTLEFSAREDATNGLIKAELVNGIEDYSAA